MLPSSSDSLLPAVFPVALDLVPLDLPVEDLEAAPLLPAPPVLLPGLVPHHHVTHLGAGLASLQGRQVRLHVLVGLRVLQETAWYYRNYLFCH